VHAVRALIPVSLAKQTGVMSTLTSKLQLSFTKR
jgi:hypothetical protein